MFLMLTMLMKYDTHCAPLERGDWTYHYAIDIPPRWGERQALTFLCRFDNMFLMWTTQPDHDSHVAPPGLGGVGRRHCYKHITPLGLSYVSRITY